MMFFTGWHQPVNGPSGCGNFERVVVSINRLLGRRSGFLVRDWILDSGAFTRIFSGKGHLPIADYAREIIRWSGNGNMLAAVAQDWMCEKIILRKTGKTIQEHQRLTYYNYLALRRLVPENIYIMPVLQGFAPQDYVNHLRMYGSHIPQGAWVGVGSVCKRNSSPGEVEAVLMAIHLERPDLRLHGFGLKRTALESPIVWDLLYSSDSQAHGLSRGAGSNKYCGANDPQAAIAYASSIKQPPQLSIFN